MRSKVAAEAARQRLAVAISSALENKLFTHAYVEAGSITAADPAMVFSHLPPPGSIFDLASMTKALVTGPVVQWTAQIKGLSLDARVGQWSKLPWSLSLQSVTIRQLLAHRSGLPAWRNFYVECAGDQTASAGSRAAKILNRINSCPIDKVPGAERYSDVGFVMLTAILEDLWQLRIDEIWQKFARETIAWREQSDLGYLPTEELRARCISTGYCAVRQRQLVGVVHDENTWSLQGVSGHAGLFGSGEKTSKYIKSLYKSDFGRDFFANAKPPGFRVWSEESGESFGGRAAVGHWGFTGTGFWIDRAEKTYGLLLTNRVVSGRVPGEAIRSLRIEVFRAITDGLRQMAK